MNTASFDCAQLLTVGLPTVGLATIGTARIWKSGSEVTPEESVWLWPDGTEVLWGDGERILTD